MFRKTGSSTGDKKSTRTLLEESAKRFKTMTKMSNAKSIAIIVGVMVAIGSTLYNNHFMKLPVPHVALIQLEGVVERGSNTADGVILSEAIKNAIESDEAKAILIEANSGGGSPVQAETLHRTIMSYRETVSKPIYISIGELCASACLYIASSGDEVYAHKNSLIGSVGVRMDSWGVNRLLEKLDIERRTYSAGEHKAMLDPFLPKDPIVDEHLNSKVLSPLYSVFVNALKEGRGEHLDVNNPKLFTGLLWTGQEAKQLGLIDDIQTHWEVRETLLKRYHIDVIQNYTRNEFSFAKILTSEFWGDVAANAAMKLASQDDVKLR
ncbi:S49 family peptidase [Enterovibrio norvegicus]|uniref:S49 family peptidase n=1 Tax=Enterovibrio norvegicus TaxID=188144 RepID=UPI00352FE057